ncbi:MAG: hypothetical protein AABY64_14945 [Bdellovibrionota bacterium]
MSNTELPAVAKSFYTNCKKCEAERYHVVLAHTSAKSAKIKCEVCGSQKSYTLPKAAKKSSAPKSAATKTGAAKTPGRRGKNSEEAKRAAHLAEYEALMTKANETNPISYSMKAKFEANHKLDHPKFGLGIIRAIQPEKIEVVFQDEVRSLIHNRP